MESPQPLIALGGATGSGKTALAVALAHKYPNLIILSADSRQIYKRLDVGSAKVGEPATDASITGTPEPVWRADGVSQFLIDIAEPNVTMPLVAYQQEAYCLIRAAWAQGKVPVLVGGTGLYLQAVLEGYVVNGAPNISLRRELETWSLGALKQRLQESGSTVAPGDFDNKRRIIRAIERAESGGAAQPPQPITLHTQTFVVEPDWQTQRDHAPAMVDERLALGLVAETKHLLQTGVNKEWLLTMGLSYRLVIQMLAGEFPESELRDRLIHAFRQLMRRQRTWFNRMPHAYKGDTAEVQEAIADWLRANN